MYIVGSLMQLKCYSWREKGRRGERRGDCHTSRNHLPATTMLSLFAGASEKQHESACEQQKKGTMAEALESTALAAGVKRSEAGREKGEKEVCNIAGRRLFASQQAKASMELFSKA